MAEISLTVGGRTFPGYLAVPEGEGPWPGVVVVFEALGASADMRAQADRLAARGYLALLPDLYGGKPWMRCVMGAMRQMIARRGTAYDVIEASRVALAERPDCTGRVGVIGFCLGGGFALVAAARYDFQAASANYGILPRDTGALAGACPVIAHYGAKDPTLRGAAAKLERALTAHGVTHEVTEVPGAGHGFLTETSVPAPIMPVARVTFGLGKGRENAPEAWDRIFGFFGEHLHGERT
ncbi:dienelactone hydrolase family protein [Actinomadura flavalba]|uniref:dienelactone hydrolase family protein n=1 Tax=Actinomadura flavalba TaxID=1120938 RepID=UPI0004775ECB|nr:dienelactone hydrolase family protein [Actinomadura flavalba]